MAGKDNKSFQDQLKQFFRMSKNSSGASRQRTDWALTEDIKRQLCSDAPIAKRLKAVKDLNEIVISQKLEERSVEKLWSWLEDLFTTPQSLEVKAALFYFLQCLIKGQYERLGLLRAHFFRFIKMYDPTEDVIFRFDLLVALTNNGKDILYLEEEMGPFLLNWFPHIEKAGKTRDYLEMLLVLIKFNAMYVDESVLSELVKEICNLCSYDRQSVTTCLRVLDTVVAYSNLPSECLNIYIGTLCRTANIDKQSLTSWKVTRNLLGTHLGHAALFTMCRILQDPTLKDDTDLIKGAICFIQMGLWSDQLVVTLKCPPNSVLNSILTAVKNKQPKILFEVVLSMKQLIARNGTQLHDPEWEVIIEILTTIVQQIDESPNLEYHKISVQHLHETLNIIEGLIDSGDFYGDEEQFYQVISDCASARPESSIFKLIDYLARDIVPIRHMWLSNLYNLLQKFYRQESRTNVKVKALRVLDRVMKLNGTEYEDELIDRIVVPHLAYAVNDSDSLVRREAADLLVGLCRDCETKKCQDMLDILEKILLRPFEVYSSEAPVGELEITDVKSAVLGLINLFLHKIHRLPSNHATKIYLMLVTFLERHYTKPKIFEDCNLIRSRILDCFLKMRADSLCHIGCRDSTGKLQYSPYLCVVYRGNERSLTSPSPASPGGMQQQQQQTFGIITTVPLQRVFKIFILCLQQEKDWEVLSLVLTGITQVLQNKSLILSKNGNNELDRLVKTLASMLVDKSLGLPETLKHPLRPSRSDFHAAVLMVMANLASYHTTLDPIDQQKIIRCLVKYGLVHKCSKQCIMALTICTLEMRDVMVKLLPEVLLDLSKISATVHIAVPVLEFLSTLTKLPTVYASFVGDQYMAVFAISLPYTNPFKFNHYIVSLAHHVIAVWFLKCRLPFRRDFITYITKGLQTNVLVPFEETNPLRTDLSKLNEDSSNRKRSSSLTEQSSRRRDRSSTTTRPDFKRPIMDRTLLAFYEELTETCIDLMARYTFSSSSALPRRSSSTEYLLNNGHSMTWFLGNKLITITTTGCSQKALKHGLCDKCWTTCRFDSLKSNESNPKEFKASCSSDKEKEDSTHISRQNSAENNTSASSPIDENKRLSDKLEDLPSKLYQYMSNDADRNGEKQLCICWCQGWAEIYIRRATGDISWIIKMQNQLSHQLSMYDYPFSDLSTLFMSSLSQRGETSEFTSSTRRQSDEIGNLEEEISSTASVPISIPCSPNKQSPSRQNSRDSIEEDAEEGLSEDGSKSRNPVRRSNSSPEMSASWKNPFLQKQEKDESRTQEEEGSKKTKPFTKDMRVSCEAIPEEISGMGTTPPSNEPSTTTAQHPTLWSCYSYPGSAPPADQQVVPKKPSHTVPPSPNILHSTAPPLTLSLAQTVHTKSPILLKTTKSESTESGSSEKGTERISLSNLPPLISKPPQSPTQTSPRLSRHIQTKEGHEIQKSSSLNLEYGHSSKSKDKKNDNKDKQSQVDLSQTQKRDRGHTISVMSTIRKPKLENLRRAISSRGRDSPRSGISPSFVFLQLFHSAQFGNTYEKPLLVSNNPVIQRALKVLDCIPPYETHRIGVICVREGQCTNEVEILRNCFGSMRYTQFLQNLGSLIKLRDVDSQVVFLGGLEQDGNDGKFTYIWQDDVIRVTFHIATLMPNKESDPNCTSKKLHIGNNNVTIVYNESGEDYNINTIKGQFNFACVIVQPLDYNTNKVTVKAKEELIDLMGNSEPKIVSDQNVAILVRQLALHADLASLVSRSLKSQSQDPYASNWLERLRKIKNIQAKVVQECANEPRGAEETTSKSKRSQMEDFSDYT